MRAVPDPSRFKDRDHPSVLPEGRGVLGEENVIELDPEGYRSLVEMLQGRVR